MAKFALLVELKAKSGKKSEIEAFLNKEAGLVRGEPGTDGNHQPNHCSRKVYRNG